MRKARKRKYFDGYGEPVDMAVIREYLSDPGNYRTSLFVADKTVHLNVRFGEMYHKCTDEEWEEIVKYIEETMGIEEPFFIRLMQKIMKIFGR